MKKRPIEERFWAGVEKTDTCWLWRKTVNKGGYGILTARENGERKTVMVHRFSHEIHKGAIPKGLEIDHLCRVRNCVNPDHLEAVCHTENMERGMAGIVAHNRLALKRATFGHKAWAMQVRKRNEERKRSKEGGL